MGSGVVSSPKLPIPRDLALRTMLLVLEIRYGDACRATVMKEGDAGVAFALSSSPLHSFGPFWLCSSATF